VDAKQFTGSDERDLLDAMEPCEDCGQTPCRCEDREPTVDADNPACGGMGLLTMDEFMARGKAKA
jgi:hypothetical protein